MLAMNEKEWNSLENLMDELIEGQQTLLLKCARRVIPHLTDEDLLQPNDFPELENHSVFRYEEGVLSGLQSMRMALRAWQKNSLS